MFDVARRDVALGGGSFTLGGVLVELARAASWRGGVRPEAPGVSRSVFDGESDYAAGCPIRFEASVTIESGQAFLSGAGFGAAYIFVLRGLLRLGRLVHRFEAAISALWGEAPAAPVRPAGPFVRRPDGLPR
jgi:hypothetical protein